MKNNCNESYDDKKSKPNNIQINNDKKKFDGDEKTNSEKHVIRKRLVMNALLGLMKIKYPDWDNEDTKIRAHKTTFQKNVLLDVFKITKFPARETREDLAILLKQTTRGIQLWFQNQRNKTVEDKNELRFEKEGKKTLTTTELLYIFEGNLTGIYKKIWFNLTGNFLKK
ncbi:HD8 [Hepatospora eriocheir]|uniref:HD8 n=1 Tax=Hepatospora eriocheir TaxID=1081669 RepID=A0A1X0QCA0_9MICR|nr:HD8 [Hepatospora eriocheir]